MPGRPNRPAPVDSESRSTASDRSTGRSDQPAVPDARAATPGRPETPDGPPATPTLTDVPDAATSEPGGLSPAVVVSGVGKRIDALYRWLERNRVSRFPWAVIQTFSRAQASLLAGSMAYYTFLSVPSLLLVGAFVLGTFAGNNASLEAAMVEAANRVLPVLQGTGLVESLVNSRVAFGIIGLLSTFYAASGFVGALTASLNRMWRVQAGRNPIGQKILNIIVVLLLAIVMVGSALVTVWARILAEHGLGAKAAPLVQLIDWVATPLTILVVLAILYCLLPARTLSLVGQLPGAVLGAAGFVVLKYGFGIWASHSRGLSALPRSVLSLVLLLIWLGFFAQLMLYGAAVNVVWRRRRAGEALMPPAA